MIKSTRVTLYKREFDYLIVGAGLFGATFARLATDAGFKCLVIDKRKTIGGNLYCENTEGINVHKYGAHIFHTSNKEIWTWVNRFAEFNRYTNSPVAVAPDGRLYNLPFNMNTFNEMWGCKTPQEATEILDFQRNEAIAALNGRKPANLEEQALSLIGRDIYLQLIKGYTEKQWGRPCNELPTEIIRRLPFRLVFDNNYFNDTYQGIPIGGYNPLIEKLLEGSEVILGCDYLANREELDAKAKKILYTGALDSFFDYRFGKLQYRTVRFETEILDTPNYQGNAVVNYTSADVPYTRIIEHKHFESFGNAVYDNSRTVISREYPLEWTPELEPYYPINDQTNSEVFRRYKELAESIGDRCIFGGRLADYAYYDMAPTIEHAMELFNKEIKK